MPSTKVQRVMLKFRDTVNLPYVDDVGNEIERQGIGPWSQLEQQHAGIRVLRLYRSLDQDALRRLVERGTANDPEYRPPNFLTYFVVEAPLGGDIDSMASTLRSWALVELAYNEPRPYSPGGVNPGMYALNASQGYEDAAPVGIDARCAWNIPGGDGHGQAVIDMEVGWTLNHHDFVAHHPALLFGAIEDADRSHGTSVLGFVCAVGNNSGIVGIAPNVQAVNVVSYKADPSSQPSAATIPDAIAQAVLHLAVGNVLLLEVELNFLPCESDPACFAAIRLATAAGIAVVEAAGNGNQNLDQFVDALHHPILLRAPGNPWFTDSLAIMVASSTTTVPHARRASSNHGSRIDCYAWGDSVQTCSSANAGDTGSHTVAPEFMDTSAAAAIIAGAALSVQGMREAAGLARFDPADLRAALQKGTPSSDPIGVMPDLCAIGGSITYHRPPSSPTNRPSPPRNLRVIG